MTKRLYSVLDLRTAVTMAFALTGLFTFGCLLLDQASRRLTDDIGPQIVGSGLVYKAVMLAVFTLCAACAVLAVAIIARSCRQIAATRPVLQVMPVGVFPQARLAGSMPFQLLAETREEELVA